jgi:predicted Zn-dependent peptidase
MAVTAADVQRVARKYIDLDALQVVAVGDASQIKPILEKYGSVEIFDTDGKPLLAQP